MSVHCIQQSVLELPAKLRQGVNFLHGPRPWLFSGKLIPLGWTQPLIPGSVALLSQRMPEPARSRGGMQICSPAPGKGRHACGGMLFDTYLLVDPDFGGERMRAWSFFLV